MAAVSIGNLYDLHTHTVYSADGEKSEPNTPYFKGKTAKELGFSGIAFTDHFDLYGKDFTYPPLADDLRYFNVEIRRNEVFSAKNKLSDNSFSVYYGVELGGQFNSPSETEKVVSALGDLDIIIGSVHRTHNGFAFYLNAKKNFEGISDEEIKTALDEYIYDLEWQSRCGFCDTLAHCTYPFRYTTMCGKGELFHVSNYYDAYIQIMKNLIEKGRALEINTAGLFQPIHETSPGNDILKMYRDMGGELITIGSDSHKSDNVGKGIAETVEVLKALGFKYQCVFEKRKMKVLPL